MKRIPAWLKIAFTVWILVWIPFYTSFYGPQNFLWSGLILQSLITWIILPLTYLLSDPARNINWIYRPFGVPRTLLATWLYFVLLMIAYPLLVYLPTHGLVLLACRWKRTSKNSV